MTNADQINDLIQHANVLYERVTELLADQQTFLSDTQTQVAATLAAAPSLYRAFNIDAEIGDDTNIGSIDSPIASIDEAIARSPRSGICDLKVYGEYVIDHIIGVNGQQILIRGDENKRAILRPTHENLADNTDFAPGFSFRGNYGFSALRLQGLKIILPATPSTISASRLGLVHASNANYTRFHTCEIEVPDGCNRSLLTLGGNDALHVSSTVTPADMGGHWVSGVADGTDPSTLPLFSTNLTSL